MSDIDVSRRLLPFDHMKIARTGECLIYFFGAINLCNKTYICNATFGGVLQYL